MHFLFAVRTVLLAIIGFMPSRGEGAIGALEYTREERRKLAKKYVLISRNFAGFCTNFGKLINSSMRISFFPTLKTSSLGLEKVV